jgi:hypothetical protein
MPTIMAATLQTDGQKQFELLHHKQVNHNPLDEQYSIFDFHISKKGSWRSRSSQLSRYSPWFAIRSGLPVIGDHQVESPTHSLDYTKESPLVGDSTWWSPITGNPEWIPRLLRASTPPALYLRKMKNKIKILLMKRGIWFTCLWWSTIPKVSAAVLRP